MTTSEKELLRHGSAFIIDVHFRCARVGEIFKVQIASCRNVFCSLLKISEHLCFEIIKKILFQNLTKLSQ